MTLAERTVQETRTMPVHTQQQVMDFVQFLKQRRLEEDMDVIIEVNLSAWKEFAK